MKNFTYKKCILGTNEKFGRFVIAAEDIKAGELLLNELPFVCGPYWNTKVSCLNCYASSDTMCKKCKLVPLCWNCSECHDIIECQTLQKLELPENFLIENFDVVTPLRFLFRLYRCAEQMKSNFGDDSTKTDIDDILSLESHCVERKGTWIWNEHAKCVIDPLHKISIDKIFESVNSPWPITDDFFQKICGILDVNTFEVRTEHFEEFPIRGLYAQASLLAHDCVGNTFITLDECKRLKVFASVDIKTNDIIFNNYTATLYGTEARQEHLVKGKYFECECERCRDPSELGTHLSSVKCESCPIGYMIQIKPKSNWKCLNCNADTTNANMQQLMREIRHQVHQNGMDIERIESFILKYTQILHPNHYLLIEMKQKLAAIIRHITSTMAYERCYEMNSNRLELLLKRKIELCKEFLPLFDILQPGISRLKAIALYEHFVPLVQLGKLYHQRKSINDEEYLSYLCEGEAIAKESIRMLLYEPTTNPEGMLAKQAMRELKELRMTKVQFEKRVKRANANK